MGIFSLLPRQRPQPDRPVPEADKGLRAWMMLLAISITHMFTWGFTISFGIFREFYFQNPTFAGNQVVAEIGVLGTGMIQILCPFLVELLRGRPWLRPVLHWSGMVTVVAASISAAFAKTPVALIMTQGVLYGIGSGLIFAPNMSYIDEWFIARRSLASGLFFMSTSLTAAVISPVLRILLLQYSAETVLVGWGILIAVALTSAIAVIRARVPYSKASSVEVVEKSQSPDSSSFGGSSNNKRSYSFTRKPFFWLVLGSNVAQSMSQYLPSVYLPSFATQVAGASAEKAAILLTVWNLASASTQPLIGVLADKSGLLIPALVSSLVPGLTALCIWPFATHYYLLIITALCFGGFSGGFVVLRSRFASLVVGTTDQPEEELLVSGLIMLVRGCSTIASGFLGVAVVTIGARGVLDKQKYGAEVWMPLLVTVGVLACSSTSVAIGLVKRRRVGKEADEGSSSTASE